MTRSLQVLTMSGVFLCLCSDAFSQAAVEGTVQLPPRVSPPAPSQKYAGAIAGRLAQPEPPVAVVYLEGDFPKSTATNTVSMEQKGFQFNPGLLPIQKGTTVTFPNLDEDYHNVFSYSKSKRFDLGRYRKDEKPAAQVLDQPGVIRLYCEIHQHMRGAILVVDTPYFVKTDAKGKYRLEKLPAGKYTLKTWIDEKMAWEKPVELKDGETLTVDFSGK